MRTRVLVYAVAGVLLCFSGAFAAETYYVQSAKAKILWEPSFKSAVMREVPKGEALTVIIKDGNWVKVKIDFETGYVSSLVVSKQPPFKKVAVIRAEDQEIRQSVRHRASTYSSAAAARGLALLAPGR